MLVRIGQYTARTVSLLSAGCLGHGMLVSREAMQDVILRDSTRTHEGGIVCSCLEIDDVEDVLDREDLH